MMALKLAAVVFLIAAFDVGFIDSVQPDYTFIESARGYFKFHEEGATWYEARDKCKSEGGSLYYPNTRTELRLVLSELGVDATFDINNLYNGWIHIGISDLHQFHDYRTLDGRPISEVDHEWNTGRPDSITNKKKRCGTLFLFDYKLDMGECDSYKRRFICKNSHSMDIVVTNAVDEMKTIIVNSSDKQALILERLAQAAAKQAAALERLTAHQDVAMERNVEVGANQTALEKPQ